MAKVKVVVSTTGEWANLILEENRIEIHAIPADLAKELARKLNAFDEMLAALKGMLANSTCTCAIGHPDNCPLEMAERAVDEAEGANG